MDAHEELYELRREMQRVFKEIREHATELNTNAIIEICNDYLIVEREEIC